MITYKRLTANGQKLTNYNQLAINKNKKQTGGASGKHCALCGCHGKRNYSL